MGFFKRKRNATIDEFAKGIVTGTFLVFIEGTYDINLSLLSQLYSNTDLNKKATEKLCTVIFFLPLFIYLSEKYDPQKCDILIKKIIRELHFIRFEDESINYRFISVIDSWRHQYNAEIEYGISLDDIIKRMTERVCNEIFGNRTNKALAIIVESYLNKMLESHRRDLEKIEVIRDWKG